MKRIITGLGLVLLIGVLFLIGASSFLQRKWVPQAVPGRERARLILPNYWSKALESSIFLEREDGARTRLFYGLFEQPFMLLPGREPSTVMCPYRFDIKDEVIVFDLRSRPSLVASRIDSYDDLEWIVQSPRFPFRRANPDELRYAIKMVREMRESDYRRVIVPTVDFGWFRLYPPHQGMVEFLEGVLTDTVSPNSVSQWVDAPR